MPSFLNGKLVGLCGIPNGEPSDDLTTSEGKTAISFNEFSTSWKVPNSASTCPTPPCSEDNIKQAYSDCLKITYDTKKWISMKFFNLFLIIYRSQIVNLEECNIEFDKILQSCISKTCKCLQTENAYKCKCDAAAEYAAKCFEQKAPHPDISNWRIDTNCCKLINTFAYLIVLGWSKNNLIISDGWPNLSLFKLMKFRNQSHWYFFLFCPGLPELSCEPFNRTICTQNVDKCDSLNDIFNEVTLNCITFVCILNKFFVPQCQLENSTAYIEACRQKACHDPNAVCRVAESYAAACRGLGRCINWRSKSFCPYKECPKGFEYKPCNSGCLRTCKLEDTHTQCIYRDIEGCFCPSGQV